MTLVSYTLFDVRRVFADRSGIFFSVAFPVAFYILFGAIQSYSESPLMDGNAAAYVMVGMALYGGVVAAAGTSGSAAVDSATGWGRQIALTPLTVRQQIVSKVVVIVARVTLPVLAVFVAGIVTPASMPAGEWLACALATIIAALPFGLYGWFFGLIFRSESAVSISAASIVILSFAANTLMPLTESLIPFARWTPMYGATALARYPLTDGVQVISDGSGMVNDSLSYATISWVVWSMIFVIACGSAMLRDKARQ